ncbi:MAG: heavy-metal-associated domain-containing protein [Anaerolineae bacterium]|nr:heavy-metal-associated domain-containing protein [Anaerolineae bacterium]
MEQMTLRIPRMWADHHVLAVRRALVGIGLQEIEASSGRRLVRLSYDPAAVERGQILSALAEAGYTPAEEVEFQQPLPSKEPGSAWFTQDARATQTNRLDLEMSGDFRKY